MTDHQLRSITRQSEALSCPDGRHDLLFAFPPRRQRAIARVQPVLRLPGDRFYLLTDGLLALEERPPPGRPVSVRPGRLNHDAPQVGIAGLGDPAAADPVTAGVLAGHRAAVAHQLPGPAKARDLAQFGHDRGRGHLRDSTQGLQRGDHGSHRGGGRLHRLVQGGLEPREAIGHVFDLVEIIQERRLLRRFGKPDVLHPQEIPLGPAVDASGRAPAVSQQKLPQPMARAQLIFLRRLAGAYHVPQRLVRGVRDPHRRQVARAVAPCQFQGVAPIRLDTVAGLHRDQGGRDDLASHTEGRQLPIEDIPGGARLVTRAQLFGGSKALHQFTDRFRAIRNHPHRPHRPVRLRHGDRDRVRVHIKTDKLYLTS